jgi:hypothetical protein
MSESYFKNFKTITYANNQAIDLTERVVVLNNLEKNPYIFYPTDITNGARADQIAAASYNDPYSSWLLYLSNDIVDPYYEWYLNDRQFNEFVGSKYGSVEQAQQKIAYYYNNWVDKSPIESAAFDALSPNQQKYWVPIYDNLGRIFEYERQKIDWHAATNYIVNLTITGTSNFITDEIVNIKYTDMSSGTAQVAFANSTILTIRHCSSDFFPRQEEDIIISDMSYVYGKESGSNCNITQCTFIANNIPSDEYSYWQGKSYYEVEQEKNEGNKTIRVLQSQYVPRFIRNTKQLLGQ